MRTMSRLFALLLILPMAGCIPKYVQPSSAGEDVATLTFVHGAGTRGSSFFRAYSEKSCPAGGSLGRLATLDIIRASEQTVHVGSNKEMFIMGGWVNGFGTRCPEGYGLKGNEIITCLESCNAMTGFTPQAGTHYQVSIEQLGMTCRIYIINQATRVIDNTSHDVPVASGCTQGH